MVERAGAPEATLDLIADNRVDQKRADARALVARLQAHDDARAAKPAWELARPTAWRRQLERLVEARRAREGLRARAARACRSWFEPRRAVHI